MFRDRDACRPSTSGLCFPPLPPGLGAGLRRRHRRRRLGARRGLALSATSGFEGGKVAEGIDEFLGERAPHPRYIVGLERVASVVDRTVRHCDPPSHDRVHARRLRDHRLLSARRPDELSECRRRRTRAEKTYPIHLPPSGSGWGDDRRVRETQRHRSRPPRVTSSRATTCWPQSSSLLGSPRFLAVALMLEYGGGGGRIRSFEKPALPARRDLWSERLKLPFEASC